MKNISLLLKLPIHLALIFSGDKDFRNNPVIGSPVLNRMGLHITRKRFADAACKLRRYLLEVGLDKNLVSNFQANGFFLLDNFLPQKDFVGLRREIASLSTFAVEMTQTPALTRRFNLDATTCADYPILLSLIKNHTLLRLLRYAAGYSGSPIIAVQCIHTDSCQSGQDYDPQTDWHTDTFHSTAKAWLFLHDVAAEDGPFAYIPGSNQLTIERLAWERAQSVTASQHTNPMHAKGSFRVSPTELEAFDYPAPVMVEARANTLVVADTSGFHRRTPSTHPTLRIEIYLSLRRNPFFAGIYPSLLSLPWISTHWAGLALNMYRWMSKRGKNSWHPCEKPGLTESEKAKLKL